MAKPGRSIFKMIFNNFIQSFRPRQVTGTLIGKDYFGNEYFEIPPNPRIGKRNSSRWFEPALKDDFEQEIPAEWEAWLRGRRKQPPLEEEVLENKAISEMKKKNAKEIEATMALTRHPQALEKVKRGMESFPTYDEYESMPGKPKTK